MGAVQTSMAEWLLLVDRRLGLSGGILIGAERDLATIASCTSRISSSWLTKLLKSRSRQVAPMARFAAASAWPSSTRLLEIERELRQASVFGK